MLLLPQRVFAYVSVITIAMLDCQARQTHVRREEGPTFGIEAEAAREAHRSHVLEDPHILLQSEATSDNSNVLHTYFEIKKADQQDSPDLSKRRPESIRNPADDVSDNFFLTANLSGNNSSSSGGGSGLSNGGSNSSFQAYGPQRNRLPTERLKEQPLVYQTEQTKEDQRHKRQSSNKVFTGTGWTMKNDLSYKVIPPAPWTETRQLCRSMNAFLADIKNKSEEDYTYDFLNSLGFSRVWIGLNDRQVKNKWVWDSGQRVTYVNWNRGEPSNTIDGENCAGVYAHKRDGFSYFNCRLRLPGLCQRRGTECGDTVLGSGIIRSPGFSANYASNRKCTFTVQAEPGAAGILLQIQRDTVDSGFNHILISSKLGVQLALSAVQQPQNITVDSPATISYSTEPSSTAAGFIITFSSVMSSNEFCGSGWTMKRGSCYRLTRNPVSWFDALRECSSMNCFLTDVGNIMEEIDIYEFLDMNALSNAWIGFNYREDEKRWVWSSGRPATYSNWHGLQPYNAGHGEDCVQLNALYRNGFEGTNCSTELRGVCKKLGRACGGNVSGSGIVQSPGFPANYARNIDCSWNIQATNGASGILMQVLHFSTETCCDHLKVLSTSGFQLSLSGVQKPFNITLGTSATVFFTTDYSGESRGFTIAFTSILRNSDNRLLLP